MFKKKENCAGCKIIKTIVITVNNNTVNIQTYM